MKLQKLKFGRLTVEKYEGSGKDGIMWLCRCDCGKYILSNLYKLRTGNTQSCGCYKIEQIKKYIAKKGNNQTIPEYRSYRQAYIRCNNKNHISYKSYGGRGILFKFINFEHFIKELGKKPTPEHTLDRIDVNGNYEPDNCKWSTFKEQCSNKRNSVKMPDGRLAIHVAEENGISRCIFYTRYNKWKWSIEDSVTLPVKKRKRIAFK